MHRNKYKNPKLTCETDPSLFPPTKSKYVVKYYTKISYSIESANTIY